MAAHHLHAAANIILEFPPSFTEFADISSKIISKKYKDGTYLHTFVVNIMFTMDDIVYQYMDTINYTVDQTEDGRSKITITSGENNCCFINIIIVILHDRVHRYIEETAIKNKPSMRSSKTSCFVPEIIPAGAKHKMTDLLQMLKTYLILFYRSIIISAFKPMISPVNMGPIKIMDLAEAKLDKNASSLNTLFIRLSPYKIVRGEMPLYYRYGYRPTETRSKTINKIHRMKVKNIREMGPIFSAFVPDEESNETPVANMARRRWNTRRNARNKISEKIIYEIENGRISSSVNNKHKLYSEDNLYFLNQSSPEWLEMSSRFKLQDIKIIDRF